MPWIKYWLDARTDRKLAALTGDEFRVWNFTLLYAADKEDEEERGKFRVDDEHLFALEVAMGDVALLRQALGRMMMLHLIGQQEDGTYFFPAFPKRQKRKPSDDAEKVRERVARHRAKKRLEEVTPVTPPESSSDEEDGAICNAPVTPGNAVKRAVTRDVTPIRSDIDQTTPPPPPARASDTRSRAEWSREFGAFYDAYPAGHKNARSAWQAWEIWQQVVRTDRDVGLVMEGLEWWTGTESWRDKNGRFVQPIHEFLDQAMWRKAVPKTIKRGVVV